MNWPSEIDGASVQRVVDAQALLALEYSGPSTISEWQTRQLTALVHWLMDNVPWWQERLGTGVDLKNWTSIPVLSRFELRRMVAMYGAAPVPEHHGAVSAASRSGGQLGAAHYFTSAFAQRLVNHAFYADHRRQGRNPFLPHACITDDIPLHNGEHLATAASVVHGLGPQALRSFDLFTKAQHMRWIYRQQPTYLTVRPDWFEVALVHAAAEKEPLPEIRQLLTFGATATDSLRRKARKWLGASVRHRYTCPECGPLAFQCPRSDAYHHVSVGNVKLEVVDDNGHLLPIAGIGTAPKAGRVLVTALHQYATPLLRYDTGDSAALHESCPGCGLAVPALSALRQNL
ncbi:MAG: AMP-binding protein [Pseudomonadota bacterium]